MVDTRMAAEIICLELGMISVEGRVYRHPPLVEVSMLVIVEIRQLLLWS